MSETVFSLIPSTHPSQTRMAIMKRLSRVVKISQKARFLGESFETKKSTPTCPFTCWVYARPRRMMTARRYWEISKAPGIVLAKNFLPTTSPVVRSIRGMSRHIPPAHT